MITCGDDSNVRLWNFKNGIKENVNNLITAEEDVY